MAGPLPALEPEDCLELCFTREASKFAYQANAESGDLPVDRPVTPEAGEHLVARVYAAPGKKSQVVVQRDDALLTPEETKQHWAEVTSAIKAELETW
eukprot:952812-Alexandrium_andersonii.AAC.1